ncbi:uncharacterized protein LOC141748465 [Larus michahellis]|uniref:uncharacterized protein LOC141748465 n=1 Tax=Larus michahellis TaxID=119627 RepID=UPI003D9AC1AA
MSDTQQGQAHHFGGRETTEANRLSQKYEARKKKCSSNTRKTFRTRTAGQEGAERFRKHPPAGPPASHWCCPGTSRVGCSPSCPVSLQRSRQRGSAALAGHPRGSFRAADTQGGWDPQGSPQHWGRSIFCPLRLGPNPFQPAGVPYRLLTHACLLGCSGAAPRLPQPWPCSTLPRGAAAPQPLAEPTRLPLQPCPATSSAWGQKPATGVASAGGTSPQAGVSRDALGSSSPPAATSALSCPAPGHGPCVHRAGEECLPLGRPFLGRGRCVTEEGAAVAAGRECSSYPPSGSFLPREAPLSCSRLQALLGPCLPPAGPKNNCPAQVWGRASGLGLQPWGKNEIPKRRSVPWTN